MNVKKTRAILSTLLILSALVSIITGAILYFLKYGMWLIFTRNFLFNTHAVSGLIMGIMVVAHFIINYRIYQAEVRGLFSKGKNDK